MLRQYRMPTLLTTYTPYANMVGMSNAIEQSPVTGETIRHDGAEWTPPDDCRLTDVR